MKKIMILLIAASCVTPSGESPRVSVFGNLRSIMMENKLDATIALDSLADLEHLYALGAATNLDGEVLVWDSQPMVTRVDADSVVSNHDFSGGAALLIYSTVSEWKKIQTENEMSAKDLEEELQRLSIAEELQQPFPFIITTSAANIQGHVVGSGKDQSHDSGYKIKSENHPVEILGFYSDRHQGIFTHHDSNMHMHFKDTASTFNAHVDELQLNGKSVILLPKRL